jgi:demethylmenaquinone methyltransferase/2-methoxy-6-polyprenyl-1,4-benzoquinol methylase
MLAVARERQGKADFYTLPGGNEHGTGGIHFQHADALSLPFANDSFEIVTVGYGLRNLSSWESGLREIHRVAKPGARLLVLDFGKPDNAAWRSLYFAYLRCVVPVFGKLFCGDAATHAYILESLKHYPAQRGVAEAMRQLGCRDVRIVNLLGGAISINFGVKA